MISIKLLIKPMPSPRPRVTKNITFMPKSYTEHKKLIQDKLHGFNHMGTVPLSAEYVFVFKRAKSSKKNKFSMPVGDCDNLIKTYQDAMEGILFENDRQIVEVCSKKMWGDSDSVSIKLKEILI